MATKTKDRRTRATDRDELEMQAALEPKEAGGNGGNGAAKGHARKEPVYSHETKKRCPRCSALMRAVKTSCDGELKHWVCTAPVCRQTAVSTGTRV
jgi:hypothetical protein